MSLIISQNLYRVYNATAVPVNALNGVNLKIEEGEFTAIVGPSGSGKTTLLNILGGLDSPSGGTLEIAGNDISKLNGNQLIDFRLKNIGFVFQAYNLIPVLSARENVEFIMLLQGWEKKEREDRAVQLLEEVGLKERIHNKPSELSGGQQQRVAVARALASRPRFVLADEPTANLDSNSTNNLLDIMSMLNKEEKMTFIFSTHDQRVIDRARRVITLEDGQIKSDIIK
ncbi:taurine transport system ATP-binding protein [Flavobacteriales bacterium]|nr:putative ABC transporter ATP-binding protein YknY [Flavobacteriales bacterium]WKZ74575.1 MAG: ABC transporter ATP-binding protein [Vicingaceae bacterium]CAG0965009.1 taurine transport system ATP-binding protein [Flavobacteriales bacterium]